MLSLTSACSFHSYWGYEHNYHTSDIVASIRDGGLVRAEKAWHLPPSDTEPSEKHKQLVVLDPFIVKVSHLPSSSLLCHSLIPLPLA